PRTNARPGPGSCGGGGRGEGAGAGATWPSRLPLANFAVITQFLKPADLRQSSIFYFLIFTSYLRVSRPDRELLQSPGYRVLRSVHPAAPVHRSAALLDAGLPA